MSVVIFQKEGWTAIMEAACEGHLEVCRFLIDTGCKIDATNRGRTALHLAAEMGHLQITRYLVELSGVNLLVKTRKAAVINTVYWINGTVGYPYHSGNTHCLLSSGTKHCLLDKWYCWVPLPQWEYTLSTRFPSFLALATKLCSTWKRDTITSSGTAHCLLGKLIFLTAVVQKKHLGTHTNIGTKHSLLSTWIRLLAVVLNSVYSEDGTFGYTHQQST
ncbi:unnamed protein product [Mytilus edulis]|uniref:Uncharacterized protein n=1 Tax=Mytilus edulis TaxID=6550 RepID=A0A8S3Q8X3_MYTED|nr:unnamed protein product [Mytilus edulis]